ncbi:MAG TPA: hypothetical protein VG148_01590, partial [Pyrinomonadaceae bacterium]|nr:hypothetical protein [Pyrinomonadaceae bacterium]
NHGVEGPTDDPEILHFRARQMRNFLATLLLSQGVPMIVAGDEFARTQGGNNNAWCQDNETSWVDWNLAEENRELLEFTRELIRIFRRHPVLRRRKFFQGRPVRGAEIKDISWFRPDGEEMTEGDWRDPHARSLAVRLAGDAMDEVDERGRRITDDTLLILLNAHHRGVTFQMPERPGGNWEQVIDTREGHGRRRTRRLIKGGTAYRMEARSLALFRLRPAAEAAREQERPGEEETSAAAPPEAETLEQPATAEVVADSTAEAAPPGPGEPPTQSVFCQRSDAIVALDGDFCRGCSQRVFAGDGVHRELTPEMLERLGYATTPVPETEAQGEPTDEPDEADEPTE